MLEGPHFHIIAGHAVVESMRARRKPQGDDALVAQQRADARAGLLGIEVICSGGPRYNTPASYSIRYDSGLQNFGLLASGRRGDLGGNTLEEAEAWAHRWVAKDPGRRYAWRRCRAVEELLTSSPSAS